LGTLALYSDMEYKICLETLEISIELLWQKYSWRV